MIDIEPESPADGGGLLRGSFGPVAALVAANLVPLWYLQHGWQASTVAMLFWWENAIVGAYAVLRILLAMKNADDWSSGLVARILIACVFVGHFSAYCYGALDVIYNVFPELTDPRTDVDLPESTIVALAVAHGVAFVFDYLFGGQFRRASPVAEMLWPYARVVATQGLVIAGAALVRDQGQAVVLIAALILTKIAFDVTVYLVLQAWEGTLAMKALCLALVLTLGMPAAFAQRPLERAADLEDEAWSAEKLGEYDHAEMLYREALAIRQKVLGYDHRYLARSLSGIGLCLLHEGHAARAEVFLRTALPMWEKTDKEWEPFKAGSLRTLGAVLIDLRRSDEAVPFLKRALTIQEKLLGRDDPESARTRLLLGIIDEERGDLKRAESAYRDTLRVFELRLGREQLDTAWVQQQLANLLGRQERYAEAEPLLRHALSVRSAKLGPRDPLIADSAHNLGVTLTYLRLYPEAIRSFMRAVAIRQKALGLHNAATGYSCMWLAKNYKQTGDVSAAREMFGLALQILEEQLGTADPDARYARAELLSLR